MRAVPSLADDQWQIEHNDEYQFVASLAEAVKQWEELNRVCLRPASVILEKWYPWTSIKLVQTPTCNWGTTKPFA